MFASGSAGVGLIILLLLYFVPSVVAFVRHHHNQWAIFALNLFLGWSVLGWIGALVWSLTRPAQVVHVVHDQPQSTQVSAPPPTEPPAQS